MNIVGGIKVKKMKTKVAAIKKAIKNKTYDWEAAIKHTAERICEHPESLLWKKVNILLIW